MRITKRLTSLSLFTAAILLSGCKIFSPNSAQTMQGESLVLAGQEPGHLAFVPSHPTKLILRNTYLENRTNTLHYALNQDYGLDKAGGIWRLPGSRIPDFRTNVLYGKEDFNHGNFSGYGNSRYFVYADYAYKSPAGKRSEHDLARGRRRAEDPDPARVLRKTLEKLCRGEKVRIVAFGDSITAGGEASEPALIYWERWAESLRNKYPKTTIETINGATGGDTTVQGLGRLEEKVLSQHPGLVLIAFGMNDHNREGFGVPIGDFSRNLRSMVDRIRAKTSAEIILVSAFPPNPKWHFGSHHMEDYAAATQETARETGCAYADVYSLWLRLTERKKPEDVLANDINHPNDFGHWIYFQALQRMIRVR